MRKKAEHKEKIEKQKVKKETMESDKIDGRKVANNRKKRIPTFSKRDHIKLAIRRAEVAKLTLRGFTYLEISQQIGITVSDVAADLKYLREQRAKQAAEDTKRDIEKKLLQLAEIQKEAWIAWEKSKKGLERITEQRQITNSIVEVDPSTIPKDQLTKLDKIRIKNGLPILRPTRDFQVIRQDIVREGRSGDSAYLHIILECMEKEIKLLGLEPPKEINVKAAVLPWDELIKLTSNTNDNPIEDTIQKLIENHPPVREIIEVEEAVLNEPDISFQEEGQGED